MSYQLSQVELDQLTLWYLVQHSLSSYYKLISYFNNATSAIEKQQLGTWQNLNIHRNHISRLHDFYTTQGQIDFQQRLETTLIHCDHILFHTQEAYPEALLPYADSPPILFLKGHRDLLYSKQIAMVGSRQPGPHGAQIAYDFSHYFAEHGYTITSGLAVGIDAAAHSGAFISGQTIAVIGTGLDQCYPSSQQSLWQNILKNNGLIMSEFFAKTAPLKQNFPRRNRIISGLSAATVVVEAGLESGSLITAKLAAEQGKHVFAIPGHIYSPHHQGCHQLIREGAILVDHPQQVLDDIHLISTAQPVLASSPKKKVSNPPPPTQHKDNAEIVDLSPQLQFVLSHLDWLGLSVDELAQKTQLDISELNIALVELELLGLCKQHAGRYLRT